MADFDKLITGFRSFKATRYSRDKDMILHSVRQGVKPKTLFITTCALRISPDALFSAQPGELYVIRNMGGIVPAYSEDGANGTIAAIEHAVKNLYVENIIVLGHAKSEGISQLLQRDLDSANDQLTNWLKTMAPAKEAVLKQLEGKTEEEQERALEQETILVSLRNLLEYPFVKERVEKDDIDLYGWHFNIESGILMAFNPLNGYFDPIG